MGPKHLLKMCRGQRVLGNDNIGRALPSVLTNAIFNVCKRRVNKDLILSIEKHNEILNSVESSLRVYIYFFYA